LTSVHVYTYTLHMKTISTIEFRANMPKYLNKILESGGEVALMRRGKPIAKVVPYNEEDKPWMKYYGFLKDDGISGVEYEDKVRRNKKERAYTDSLRRKHNVIPPR
jgi:antitoxin (DNA-binding transcriptional repressor) of toxin-antitoxin stability system